MRRYLVVVLAVCFWVNGCGTRAETASNLLPVIDSQEITRNTGGWIFRHALVLDVAGRGAALSFTGMMRLDADREIVDVVGLGGVGLTLFDLKITRSCVETRFLHPSLARLPGVGERIAALVRLVWLDCLPLAMRPPQGVAGAAFAACRDMRETVRAVHGFEGGRLRWSRMEKGATVKRLEYSAEGQPPREMIVTGKGYSLVVRLVEARRLEGKP